MTETEIAKLIFVSFAAGLAGGLVVQGLTYLAGKVADYVSHKRIERRMIERLNKTVGWYSPPQEYAAPNIISLASQVRDAVRRATK